MRQALLLLLSQMPLLHAAASADYRVAPEAMTAGGTAAASATYRQSASAVGAIASSGAAATHVTIRPGIIGALNERDLALVALAAAAYQASEAAGTLTVTVLRQGDDAGAVTVPFALSGGTAVPGTAIGPVTGNITFADGAVSASVAFSLHDDGVVAGARATTLALGTPVGPAALGAPAQAAITLLDAGATADPTAAPGRLRIVSEPPRWVAAGDRWTYRLEVDPRTVAVSDDGQPLAALSVTIEDAPVGMRVQAADAWTAIIDWPQATGDGHRRFAVRVRDGGSGAGDRQRILLYVVPVAGGAN
jgi:hypothetical protein